MPTIWLDAGHGGKDVGAISSDKGTFEKDVALALVLEIADILKKNNVNVILTRDKDMDIKAPQRWQLENKNKCDLAVSIHLNSCKFSNTGTGFEIWVHHNANADTMAKAKKIEAKLAETKLKNRGIKKGYIGNSNVDFWVNRETKSASMLIEVGFVNNDFDLNYILNNLHFVAKQIAQGIANILGNSDNKVDKVEEKPKPIETVKKPVNKACNYNVVVYNLNDKNSKFLTSWLDKQQYRWRKETL